MSGRRARGQDGEDAVLAALRRAGRPISAYEIIAMAAGRAVLAPATVYRILDRLIARGEAHKVQSLNAFVACTHTAHQEAAAFAICDGCGTVTEFTLPKVGAALERWSRDAHFAVASSAVELRGLCGVCQANATPPR